MKNISRLIFLFLIISLLPFTSFSQSKSGKVRTRLIELFDLCKNDKYPDAASYIVYSGDDKSRSWKDVYDYNNEMEAKDVDMVCRRIKSILETGSDYEFIKFQTETETEGEWCIWELKFSTGEQKKIYFAFLKIKGKYCLGDID